MRIKWSSGCSGFYSLPSSLPLLSTDTRVAHYKYSGLSLCACTTPPVEKAHLSFIHAVSPLVHRYLRSAAVLRHCAKYGGVTVNERHVSCDPYILAEMGITEIIQLFLSVLKLQKKHRDTCVSLKPAPHSFTKWINK